MKMKQLLIITLCLALCCAVAGCAAATPQQSVPEKIDPPKPPSIIIDTDPGTDDSTALMLAQANLGERVGLLVSSYGNSPLSSTTANTARLADLYGMQAIILQGAALPVEGARMPALTEGENGIASAGLPESAREIIQTDPSDYLYEYLKANPGSDYVVLGPMTNLANLLSKHPDAKGMIGRVITMAGGLSVFNMDDCAEFNIHCDPVAAEQVFASGLPIYLVPLDTTNQIVLTHQELLAIPDGKTQGSGYLNAILLDNERTSLSWGLPGAVIYDAAALAYLIDPGLFTIRQTGITVSAGESYGQTSETAERSNVYLVEAPNRDGVYDLIVQSGHRVFTP